MRCTSFSFAEVFKATTPRSFRWTHRWCAVVLCVAQLCIGQLPAFAECVDAPSDVAAWWRLDEQSGQVAIDLANHNDGTYVNGPVPIPEGYVHGALTFDGVNDFVRVPDNDSLDFGTGDFSIDVWVKSFSQANIRTIVDKLEPGHAGFALSLLQGNSVNFALGDATGYFFVNAGGFPNNEWTHVAVTVTRGSTTGGKIYINGALSLTFSTVPRPGSVNNTQPLRIGQGGIFNNGQFNGAIDELTLYRRVLTPQEIAGIVQAGTAGKCEGFSCSTVQNYDRNLRKYWRYRDRYNSGFTVQGDQCGNAIPAADRGGDTFPAPEMRFGDAVNDMGYYFGVLATEYRLLRNNAQATTTTEQQIYFALQELNRLDAYAESAWTSFLATGALNFCQAPADMNGFMIRDDTPNNFVNTYNTQLNSEVGRLYSINVSTSQQKVRPTEISQDHLFSLLTGLALVAKLVDANTVYNGMNLVQETKNIVARFTGWIQGHQWVIVNPIRNRCVFGISNSCWANPPDPVLNPVGYLQCCSDGGAVTLPYSVGFAEAANKIIYGFTPGMMTGGFLDSLAMQTDPAWIFSTMVWAPPTWHGENFVQQLSAVGDSIHDSAGTNWTVPRLNLRALAIHREHLPLIHDVLYGRGHLIPDVKLRCLIDSAPCSGPFGRLYGRTGPYEWATPNRFKIDPGERILTSVIDRCREYYGLDFMLLYNLYRLVGPVGPAYEKLQLPPQAECDYCDNEDPPSVDCDCIAAAGTVTTCKKQCRTHKRECKEVCQIEKEECTETCAGTKQTCYNDCNARFPNNPVKRGSCKLGCVIEKWGCSRNCRIVKRGCKQDCRDVFSDCKDVCTTGTPAEREQYCRDSVVRSSQGIYQCQ